MSNFIAFNEEEAFAFEEKLSKTPFRDKEIFIQMYNGGLINRKNAEVESLIQEIITLYKGIEKRADGVTFLDEGEISAEELIVKAEAYSFLLRLQRILKSASQSGLVDDNSFISISANNTAELVDFTEDGDSSKRALSSEKLPKLEEAAAVIAGNLLGLGEELKKGEPFEATSVLRVNSRPVIAALAAFA